MGNKQPSLGCQAEQACNGPARIVPCLWAGGCPSRRERGAGEIQKANRATKY